MDTLIVIYSTITLIQFILIIKLYVDINVLYSLVNILRNRQDDFIEEVGRALRNRR